VKLADVNLQSDVHRRQNPLTGEWVLVSPQRAQRPWQGQTESRPAAPVPTYDPGCYLCPGNTRASGIANPGYERTYVFENDFPALRPDSGAAEYSLRGVLQARAEGGRCRVICYSPRHDLTLAQMPLAAIRQVVDTWVDEYTNLGAQPRIEAVTIFENRGALMGSSNPHPHGQIWANQTVPGELLKESAGQLQYWHQAGSCLLCDYVTLELEQRERVICANERFLAVVPFWAIWPFEALVLPRAHVASLAALNAPGRDALAQVLQELNARYDALFELSFPYTMGLHQQPTDGREYPQWHLHAHFYPPLLRSASVRKFMVGYEMLAGAQRDVTPEVAAAALRGSSQPAPPA
jgi:UDPglucose--hexose-1-phosphate uridylyltransferase